LYFCDKTKIGKNGIWMRKQRSSESDFFYQGIVNIKDIAESGESIVKSMGSLKKMPFSLADLHFVPAQVARIPLNRGEKVNTEVIIGPQAKNH